MRRFVPFFAAILAAQPAIAETGSGGSPDAVACAEGLARTLAVMEALPLMKEEMATGLMWLRLDAQVALERGDVETCLAKLASVEAVLGLSGD
jgi:hypothetical protein